MKLNFFKLKLETYSIQGFHMQKNMSFLKTF